MTSQNNSKSLVITDKSSKLPDLNLDPNSWGPGAWSMLFMFALRARTPKTIEDFIKNAVPILLGLLCSTCSESAYELILKRHPSTYQEMYDDRGENIGMYTWLIDLHNDVNKKLGKSIYSKEKVDKMWNPLLELTSDQISDDREAALSPETIPRIWEVRFVPSNDTTDTDIISKEIKLKPRTVVPIRRTMSKTTKPCKNCGNQ